MGLAPGKKGIDRQYNLICGECGKRAGIDGAAGDMS
jgi:hypothetical protein